MLIKALAIFLFIFSSTLSFAGDIDFTFGGSSTGVFKVDGTTYTPGTHTINLSVGAHSIECTPDNSGYHAGFVRMSENGNPFNWPATSVNGNTYSWQLDIINDNIGYATLNIIADEQFLDLLPTASRTTGVAPLYVFFNADLRPESATEKRFAEIVYSWDFGDPNSGNWGTDGKPRNTDNGPVAAHVFEQPGTYTVTYTGKDISNSAVESGQFTITVDDPDTVFSGSSTTCVSDTAHNDFTGCPGGAIHLTTDNLNDVVSHSGAGKRLLLSRGASWTITATIPFPNNDTGPFRIGAYGDCVNPTAQGICENAPLIHITTPDTSFVYLDRMSDWVIGDISSSGVIGSTQNSSLVGGLGRDTNKNLIMRLKATNFDSTPIGWTHWRDKDSQTLKNNAVVSCYVNNIGNINYYVGSENLAVIGNFGLESKLTHITRVWWAYKGVISHNIFAGSSTTTTTGRHALKLHGPSTLSGIFGLSEVGIYEETLGQGVLHSTYYVVVANNIFGSSGPWPVSIGPSDSWHDERLRDIISENNKILADYGLQSPQPVQVSLMFEGRYITARNNIMDGTGGANGFTGIAVERRGVEPAPLGNRVYNNTIYRRDSAVNGVVGIMVNADATDTVIRNNFVSFPGEANQTLITDDSGNAIISNNILTSTPGFVDPDNSDPLQRNFSIEQNSPAVDTGIPVPVLYDISGTVRPVGSAFDLGAYEYTDGSSSCDSSHLNLCTDQSSCEGAGGNWCTGVCQSEPCATAFNCGPTPIIQVH